MEDIHFEPLTYMLRYTVVFPVPNIFPEIFRMYRIEEFLMLLIGSGGGFKPLIEKVHSFHDISIYEGYSEIIETALVSW